MGSQIAAEFGLVECEGSIFTKIFPVQQGHCHLQVDKKAIRRTFPDQWHAKCLEKRSSFPDTLIYCSQYILYPLLVLTSPLRPEAILSLTFSWRLRAKDQRWEAKANSLLTTSLVRSLVTDFVTTKLKTWQSSGLLKCIYLVNKAMTEDLGLSEIHTLVSNCKANVDLGYMCACMLFSWETPFWH